VRIRFAPISLVLLGAALPICAQSPESRALTYLRPNGSVSLWDVTNWAVANPTGVFLLDTGSTRAANERFVESWRPTQCRTIEGTSSADQRAGDSAGKGTERRTSLAAAGAVIAARSQLSLGVMLDESSALGMAIDRQSRRGPIDTLILVNPSDPLSSLAPLALQNRRAVLLMTNNKGDDAGEVIRRALKMPGLEHIENLLILGSPSAIPPERRPNPLAGKDEFIEMEPGTPSGNEPYSLAVGRLFHADPAVVALVLARARLLPASGTSRTALVASNPGGSLPMLETFSRTSVRELQNRGYETTSLIGDQLSPGQLRRRLPEADVFLWEGHHNTLIKDWGFATWSEPLRPSFMFLQSCLALTEDKTAHLFERGALAVVGSSSRIYSATGGAFSLGYLDSVLYDEQSLGGGLRSAKNFLLAYGQLKDKRLETVKLAGANQRSAWAFTLWGDPALKLPAPTHEDASESMVRSQVRADTITLSVPAAASQSSRSGVYQAVYRPNSRLAGLVRTGDDGEKKLTPLAFSEVSLPDGPPNAVPRLRTKLADSNWVFIWDPRRRAGWLLVALPATAEREIRFHIDWTTNEG
jgi:hypothetical protein